MEITTKYFFLIPMNVKQRTQTQNPFDEIFNLDLDLRILKVKVCLKSTIL
jgi:hypothetical protein